MAGTGRSPPRLGVRCRGGRRGRRRPAGPRPALRRSPGTANTASPPDPHSGTPGQMARNRQPRVTLSPTGLRHARRRRPAAQLPARRHLLADTTTSDLARRPTLATNRQPGVTFSPTRRRPTWLSGHSGDKPTAQRHFVANPPAPGLALRPHWRETDNPASPSRQPASATPSARPQAARPGPAERRPGLVGCCG